MNRSHHAAGLRQVAIYGRVSTEHEAQLSAFSNQQAWYEEIVAHHRDWVVVGRYYDEGITGTSVHKRPAFMRMLEDARQGQFDLVITREVCQGLLSGDWTEILRQKVARQNHHREHMSWPAGHKVP